MHLIGTFPAPRTATAGVTSTFGSAVTKYTYTVTNGGATECTGSKTVIDGLGGNVLTWKALAHSAAWDAVANRTFNLPGTTWGGTDSAGMAWNGFHDSGVISTAYPAI